MDLDADHILAVEDLTYGPPHVNTIYMEGSSVFSIRSKAEEIG